MIPYFINLCIVLILILFERFSETPPNTLDDEQIFCHFIEHVTNLLEISSSFLSPYLLIKYIEMSKWLFDSDMYHSEANYGIQEIAIQFCYILACKISTIDIKTHPIDDFILCIMKALDISLNKHRFYIGLKAGQSIGMIVYTLKILSQSTLLNLATHVDTLTELIGANHSSWKLTKIRKICLAVVYSNLLHVDFLQQKGVLDIFPRMMSFDTNKIIEMISTTFMQQEIESVDKVISDILQIRCLIILLHYTSQQDDQQILQLIIKLQSIFLADTPALLLRYQASCIFASFLVDNQHLLRNYEPDPKIFHTCLHILQQMPDFLDPVSKSIQILTILIECHPSVNMANVQLSLDVVLTRLSILPPLFLQSSNNLARQALKNLIRFFVVAFKRLVLQEQWAKEKNLYLYVQSRVSDGLNGCTICRYIAKEMSLNILSDFLGLISCLIPLQIEIERRKAVAFTYFDDVFWKEWLQFFVDNSKDDCKETALEAHGVWIAKFVIELCHYRSRGWLPNLGQALEAISEDASETLGQRLLEVLYSLWLNYISDPILSPNQSILGDSIASLLAISDSARTKMRKCKYDDDNGCYTNDMDLY
jgi:hypothetical protein